MAEKFLMKNEETGKQAYGFTGFSWTALFCGIFLTIFRKDIKGTALFFVVVLISSCIRFSGHSFMLASALYWSASMWFACFYNNNYTKRLLAKGFVFAESDEKNSYIQHSLKTSNVSKVILCIIWTVANFAFGIFFASIGFGLEHLAGKDNIKTSTTAVKSSKVIKNSNALDSMEVSNILPYGELADMFNLGSKSTNLQREEKLRELAGKVVSWSLPVYEISKVSDNVYRVSVMSSSHANNVGCIIYITAENDEDKQKLLSLKTGNEIKFKGILTGDTSVRQLIIKPAYLIKPKLTKIVGQYDYGRMSSSIGNYFIMNDHDGIKYEFTSHKWYEVDALVENDMIINVLSVNELDIDKNISDVNMEDKRLFSNYSLPYSQKADLLKKYTAGDAEAAYRLGVLTYDYEKNADEALGYLIYAASKGLFYADVFRARIEQAYFDAKDEEPYDWSEEDQRRYDKLTKYVKTVLPALQKLSDNGATEAQVLAGRLLTSVLQDTSKGLEFYKKAAAGQHMDACRFLGIIYSQIDTDEAITYFEQGAKLGDKKCKEFLKEYNTPEMKKIREIENTVKTANVIFSGCDSIDGMPVVIGKDNNKEISFMETQDHPLCNGALVKGKSYTVKYKMKNIGSSKNPEFRKRIISIE